MAIAFTARDDRAQMTAAHRAGFLHGVDVAPAPAECCSEFLADPDDAKTRRTVKQRASEWRCLAAIVFVVTLVAVLLGAHIVARMDQPAKPASLGVLA